MAVAEATQNRDVAISMRFRDEDLGVIDRGASLRGMSRTEFMRRAALRDAQLAILDESIVHMSAEAFKAFRKAVDAPVASAPEKLLERLSRRAPWEKAPKR